MEAAPTGSLLHDDCYCLPWMTHLSSCSSTLKFLLACVQQHPLETHWSALAFCGWELWQLLHQTIKIQRVTCLTYPSAPTHQFCISTTGLLQMLAWGLVMNNSHLHPAVQSAEEWWATDTPIQECCVISSAGREAGHITAMFNASRQPLWCIQTLACRPTSVVSHANSRAGCMVCMVGLHNTAEC